MATLCLFCLIGLAVAGPLHVHQDLSKPDASCAVCHAGHQALENISASDAGKPCDLVPPQPLYIALPDFKYFVAHADLPSRAPPSSTTA